jgi:hypothetical protein
MKLNEAQKKFVEAWNRLGSPTLVAKELGFSVRYVYNYRKDLEHKGVSLKTFNPQRSPEKTAITIKTHEGRVDLEVLNGTVLVFSDAHYYPEMISTAHLGLLYMIKKLKPVAIINNGDAFDGAGISRHPRIGWDSKPTVIDELRAVTERLLEVSEAAPKGCRLIWPLGNHDSRYETFLAAQVPQFQGVDGFHLKDHFPEWKACWSCWINDEVVVKHRWKGGAHATWNNTINAGKSIVTGHLHQLKITPFSDYNGRRYGVDTGTLADPYGPQFIDYTEGNPVNWCSGFAVLTFKDGKMLSPELVRKWDENVIEFRGELIEV